MEREGEEEVATPGLADSYRTTSTRTVMGSSRRTTMLWPTLSRTSLKYRKVS